MNLEQEEPKAAMRCIELADIHIDGIRSKSESDPLEERELQVFLEKRPRLAALIALGLACRVVDHEGKYFAKLIGTVE